jgi:hypothetical protein
MPLSNFGFSLTADHQHQRLQDFGFEAFFVGQSQLVKTAMRLSRLPPWADEGPHI